MLERLSRFLEEASGSNIILCHENEKGIYGEKAKECKNLMDHFYGDHFKCIFDFANFIQAEENTWNAYELLKPYIAYIHVKDALLKDGSVVPAGYGDGQVARILGDLIQNGYSGYLSLEPHLFEFKGLASLENTEHKTVIQTDKALTGFEAFSLAHEALQKILQSF